MAGEMAERIGRNMRLRREALGLKQREVAERIDDPVVSGQHVSRWERAENRPGDRYLELIAQALDVDVSYFYADHDTVVATPPLMATMQPADVAAQVAALSARVASLEEERESLRARLAAVEEGQVTTAEVLTGAAVAELSRSREEIAEQRAAQAEGRGGSAGTTRPSVPRR